MPRRPRVSSPDWSPIVTCFQSCRRLTELATSKSSAMVGYATQYYCGLCPRSFDSKRDLNYHMANHDEPESPQLPCAGCNFKFSDSNALEKHILLTGHHKPSLPRAADITCDVCKKTFETQAQLSRHCQFPEPCSDFHARSRQNSSELPSPATAKPALRGPSGYIDSDAPKVDSGPNCEDLQFRYAWWNTLTCRSLALRAIPIANTAHRL